MGNGVDMASMSFNGLMGNPLRDVIGVHESGTIKTRRNLSYSNPDERQNFIVMRCWSRTLRS